MEQHARAPDPLSGTGDMSNNWRSWKEEFMIFMNVTGYINMEEHLKVNMLKNRIGKVGLDAINKFDDTRACTNMNILIQKLDNQFDPPKKETERRYNFFTRGRKSNETIDDYIANLRVIAKACNFGGLTESLIRDVVILNTMDKSLRQKYLNEDNLTLPRIAMITKQYLEQKQQELNAKAQLKNNNLTKSQGQSGNKSGCRKCGKTHPFKQCPAWGNTCEKCNEMHHYATHCPKFLQQQKDKQEQKNKDNSPKPKPGTKENLKGQEASFYNLPTTSQQHNQYVYPQLPNPYYGNPSYYPNAPPNIPTTPLAPPPYSECPATSEISEIRAPQPQWNTKRNNFTKKQPEKQGQKDECVIS